MGVVLSIRVQPSLGKRKGEERLPCLENKLHRDRWCRGKKGSSYSTKILPFFHSRNNRSVGDTGLKQFSNFSQQINLCSVEVKENHATVWPQPWNCHDFGKWCLYSHTGARTFSGMELLHGTSSRVWNWGWSTSTIPSVGKWFLNCKTNEIQPCSPTKINNSSSSQLSLYEN